MKKIYRSILAITVLILAAYPVLSQTLFVDDFSYPVRDSLEGLGGWFRSGINTEYNVTITSPGLNSTGYAGTGTGNTIFLSNNPQGDICYHDFATQVSGNLYMAFMVNVTTVTSNATQGYVIGFDQAGVTTNHCGLFYIQKASSNSKFGIAKNSGTVTYDNTARITGHTYLAVVKCSFVSGNDNDIVKLYVFDGPPPANEPANSNAETSTGTDVINLGQVFVSNSYGQSGLSSSSVKIDGIRIGTTWDNALTIGIKTISGEVPKGFALEQNYPNPFNPSTTIKFDIKSESFTKLSVFDETGREISTLVNENLKAGKYEVSWDAGSYSSGIYFYRLETQSYTDTKKMVLIK